MFSFNAIWAMFHGVQINLRFLGFESQKELVRVCKRIYKYNNPGALDAAHPKIVNFTKDGCRITVARPPMAESWMFFLRKFGSAPRTLKNSYPYKGLEKLIETIKWIVLGNMNIAVTGGQGCGKTSFLKMLPAFMRATEALRVQEMAFETELRKSYPYMNIATFAETPTVSAEEEIEFSRKSDGTASMFGEIAQAAVAAFTDEKERDKIIYNAIDEIENDTKTKFSIIFDFTFDMLTSECELKSSEYSLDEMGYKVIQHII